ncbi:MAG: hypothetical protein KDC92_11245 [Bacteroidetes bacterium]|nr:hypothetical protein [Bacteroidota bacterium]
MKKDLKFLCESEIFRIYAIYENTYIKYLPHATNPFDYAKEDKLIAWVYGNPYAALVMPQNDYVVIVGAGIVIYNILNQETEELFTEPEKIRYFDTVFQSELDNQLTEFRVVGINEFNQCRVFKFNLTDNTLKELT